MTDTPEAMDGDPPFDDSDDDTDAGHPLEGSGSVEEEADDGEE